MLTGYIRLVLECITSVSSYQQNRVFPHCLPPMQHWKCPSKWLEILHTELKPIKTTQIKNLKSIQSAFSHFRANFQARKFTLNLREWIFIWQMVLFGFNWITRQDSCGQLILADCNRDARPWQLESSLVGCSTDIETRFRGQSLIWSQADWFSPYFKRRDWRCLLLRDLRLHARSVLEISFDLSWAIIGILIAINYTLIAINSF
jgi:hypothetical protein